jgi:hypothetical protein
VIDFLDDEMTFDKGREAEALAYAVDEVQRIIKGEA